MKIIQKVKVKQVVTEKSKHLLASHFKRRKMQLEQECQQLKFEHRKLKNKPGMNQQKLKQRFNQAINVRKEKIASFEFKLEQLQILELGSEIVEGEVDALVEVKEGAKWSELMQERAIVVKDDVVLKIE